MNEYGLSDTEYKIVLKQIARRAKLREEFLRKRTDPCLHSKEAGHVVDLAEKHFYAMQVTQFEHFKLTKRNYISGFLMMAPFFVYGYLLWWDRDRRENAIRCGSVRYRDRSFKLK